MLRDKRTGNLRSGGFNPFRDAARRCNQKNVNLVKAQGTYLEALKAVMVEAARLKEKIKNALKYGIDKFSISNISGMYLMKEFGITDWICDYYLYTLNNFSAEFLLEQGAKRITLSPEDSRENMQSILNSFSDKIDILIYGDVPLFISDNCLGDCKNCKSTDTVIIKNCRHYVFAKVPYCIADSQSILSPKNFRLDFCFKKYTAQDVKNIFHNITDGQCPRNSISANFKKGFK